MTQKHTDETTSYRNGLRKWYSKSSSRLHRLARVLPADRSDYDAITECDSASYGCGNILPGLHEVDQNSKGCKEMQKTEERRTGVPKDNGCHGESEHCF